MKDTNERVMPRTMLEEIIRLATETALDPSLQKLDWVADYYYIAERYGVTIIEE